MGTVSEVRGELGRCKFGMAVGGGRRGKSTVALDWDGNTLCSLADWDGNTLCSSAVGTGGAGLYMRAISSMSLTRDLTIGKAASCLRYRCMYFLRSRIAA